MIAPVLVTPAWLLECAEDVHVIDARRMTRHEAGHVPGATPLPLHALIVEDTSRDALVRLAGAVRHVLAQRGIGPTDHVVLVDDADGTAAMGALMCELAGMVRVSTLLGGMRAWRSSHAPIEDGRTLASAISSRCWDDHPAALDHVASFEQLEHAVDHGSAYVLDVRSQLEHEGIVGPPCCAARGCIPGSRHIEWTSLVDLSGAPLEGRAMRALLESLGIDPDGDLIVTCHAGHRAAAAARYLRASGIRQARVALGSWHEWCARRSVIA